MSVYSWKTIKEELKKAEEIFKKASETDNPSLNVVGHAYLEDFALGLASIAKANKDLTLKNVVEKVGK